MDGNDMERKELVYSKTSKNGITLNYYAVNGRRDYSSYVDANGNKLIIDDKLFLLEIVDKRGKASACYPYYSDDIAECAFNIIKNKVLPSAKQSEANKIIKRINDALKGL